MNERIGTLLNRSGGEFYEGFAGSPNAIKFTEEELQTFAELIVKECIGCCEQVISDPVPESVDTWLNGGSQCIDEIKQHFGVEE